MASLPCRNRPDPNAPAAAADDDQAVATVAAPRADAVASVVGIVRGGRAEVLAAVAVLAEPARAAGRRVIG